MKNKKLSILLKISIITLLIILSTVTSVRAEYDTFNNGFYPEASFDGSSGAVVNGEVGFSTLESYSGVLCNEHGKEINDSHKLGANGVFKYGETDNLRESTNPVGSFSTYDYSHAESVSSSNVSQKVLFIIARANEGGPSHYSQWSQWQVWAMGGLTAGGSATGSLSTVLGALNFESANSPFTELYTFNNVLGEDIESRSTPTNVLKIKGIIGADAFNKLKLKGSDENYINSIEATDVADLYNKLNKVETSSEHYDVASTVVNALKEYMKNNQKNPMSEKLRDLGDADINDKLTTTAATELDEECNEQGITNLAILWYKLDGGTLDCWSKDEQKEVANLIKNHLSEIYFDIYGLDDTDENREKFDLSDDDLKEIAESVAASDTYQDFAANNLESNNNQSSASLKNSSSPTIDDSNVTTAYSEAKNAWIVGPLSVHYIDSYSDGYRIAGLTGVTLEGKYRNSTDTQKINYKKATDVDTDRLEENTYTIVTKDFGTFDNHGSGLPDSDEEFYILIGYNPDLEQVTKLGFQYSYVVAEATTPTAYTIYKDGKYQVITGYKTHIENVTVRSTVTYTQYKRQVLSNASYNATNQKYEWYGASWLEDPYSKVDYRANPVTFSIDPVDGDIKGKEDYIREYIKNNYSDKYSSVVKKPDGYFQGEEQLASYTPSSASPGQTKAINQGWQISMDEGSYTGDDGYFIDLSNANIWVEPIIEEVTWSDAQDLDELGGAKITRKDIKVEIEVPWTSTITVEKEVVDNTEKDIDVNQTFWFNVYKNAGEYGRDELVMSSIPLTPESGYKANVTLASDVVIAGYKIVEVDNNGVTYLDYIGGTPSTDSIWDTYKPANGTGEFTAQDNIVHIINTKEVRNGAAISVVKKMPLGAANGKDAFYFNIDINHNGDDDKHYRIKLTPISGGDASNLKYYDVYDENTKALLGKAYSVESLNCELTEFRFDEKFDYVWFDDNQPTYTVTETDAEGVTYADYVANKSNYPNSLWNKYEQVSTSYTTGNLQNGKRVFATVENNTKSISVDLSLFKEMIDEDGNEISVDNGKATFYVQIEKWNGNEFINLLNYSTLNVVPNGEAQNYKYTITNAEDKYIYTIKLTERQNSKYNWTAFIDENNKDIVFMDGVSGFADKVRDNLGKWIVCVERDAEGNITKVKQAIRSLDVTSGANNTFAVTATNTGINPKYYTGFKIHKDILQYIGEEGSYINPETNALFYFQVGFRNDSGEFVNVTDTFFKENLIDSDDGPMIQVAYSEDEKAYVATSEIVDWKFDDNRNLEIIELDQYGRTEDEFNDLTDEEKQAQAEDERGKSLWNLYTEKSKENDKVISLNRFDSREDVRLEMVNDTIETFKVKNVKKYEGSITIEKAVNGNWDENDVFYFIIEPINGSMDNKNNIYTYFDAADVVTVPKGKIQAIKVSKENSKVTTKTKIEWYSNEINPKFTITEVDQYGNRYHGSDSYIENEDSLWHKYKPAFNDYGTKTCQIIENDDDNFNCEFSFTFDNYRKPGTDKYLTIEKEVSNASLEDDTFYFKVFEQVDKSKVKAEALYGHDVTKDLFDVNDDGYLEISKERNSITSNAIKEKDDDTTYTVVEYAKEEEGNKFVYVTFDDYQKGTKSIFWNTKYMPENNKGIWTATLAKEETNISFKAKNTKIATGITVKKEVIGKGYEDEEFKASLTIKPNLKYSRLFIKEEDSKEWKEYENGKTYNITISENKPFVLKDCITWIGTAPIWEVQEDLSDKSGFILKGFKINDSELNNISYGALNFDENSLVITIVNEASENETALQIIKSLIDEDFNRIYLQQDSPEFYFDVYLNNYKESTVTVFDDTIYSDPNYTGTVENIIPVSQAKNARYGEGYEGFIRVKAQLKYNEERGSTPIFTFVNLRNLTVEAGKDLEFKVVEVDQHGYSYEDRAKSENDTIWKITKPASFVKYVPKNDRTYKIGAYNQTSITGTWEGTITAEEMEKGYYESIGAYNTMKTARVNFTKFVIDHKRLVELEDDFHFEGKFYAINEAGEKRLLFEDNDIVINKDNKFNEIIFILNIDDVEVTYEYTEVDDAHYSYLNRSNTTSESGFWDKYTPINSGICKGSIDTKKFGENRLLRIANVVNQLYTSNPNTIQIVKKVNGVELNSDSDIEDKFYFKVWEYENGEYSKDVTTDLFKENTKNEYLVIDKNNNNIESKEIEGSHSYIVVEYAKEGDKYVSYSDYSDGTPSKFWSEKYTPEIESGIWYASIVENSKSSETVTVEINNTPHDEPDKVNLQITKGLVDLNNKPISIKQDSPIFTFNVYFKNVIGDTVNYNGKEVKLLDVESADENIKSNAGNYKKYIPVEIQVLGEEANPGTTATAYIRNIEVKANSKLQYKVVEVDENNEAYDPEKTYETGLWSKTKPALEEDGTEDGIWEGTINSSEEKSDIVNAWNVIRRVNISLTKIVYDENGDVDQIEPNEAFVFEIVYNGDVDNKETVVIDYNNPEYNREFLLGINEELTYKVNEVGAYIDYDVNGLNGENVLGTVFTPVNGKGEITGTVGIDTDGNVQLEGENTPVPYTILPIEKILANESGITIDKDATFYFKVKSEDGKEDYTELFCGVKAKDSEDFVIEVKANENGKLRWISNPTPWVGLNNEILEANIKDWLTAEYKVNIIEVDQYGKEETATDLAEDSIWNDYTVISTQDYTLPIYGSEELAEVALTAKVDEFNMEDQLADDHASTVVNAKKLKGTISIVKEVVGNADKGDEFYFTIDPLNIDKEDKDDYWNVDIVKTYFNKADITTLKNGKSAVVVKVDENGNIPTVTSNVIEWNSSEHSPQFILTEVDQYGERWYGSEDYISHTDSTWYKYQPTRRNLQSTLTCQLIELDDFNDTFEFKNDRVVRNITITKESGNNTEIKGDFYFKVRENGKEVTSDIFDNVVDGYLVINSSNNGIKSKDLYGVHTYEITEYDENGVSFDDYTTKGTKSEFWNMKYMPANGKGVWTVTVDENHTDTKFSAVNTEIHTGLRVEKDVVQNGYEAEKFKATLTVKPNTKYSRLFIKAKGSNEWVEYKSGKDYKIEISENKPFVLEDYITWIGEKPIWYVRENTENMSNFKLVGYKVNGAQEASDVNYAVLNLEENSNVITIVNEAIEEETVLQIVKSIKDLDGKDYIALKQDSPVFNFDVYLNNYADANVIVVDSTSPEGREETITDAKNGKYGDKYEGLIKASAQLKYNEETKQTSLYTSIDLRNIKVKAGKDLEYKVVEVDQHGFSYEDKAKSESGTIWDKTKPLDGKGIFEDKVKNEDLAEGKCISVPFDNAMNVVNVKLTKGILTDPLRVGEIFYFNAEFSNGEVFNKENGNQILISINEDIAQPSWEHQFVLDLDEVLHYTITEVDGENNTYENRTETSDVWNDFKPADKDGKGILDGDVTKDTLLDATIRLIGTNEPVPYTFIQIEKTISDKSETVIDENTKFYFKVTSLNGEKDYTSIFAGEGKLIEVDANSKTIYGPVAWTESTNKVKVVEVDQYGKTQDDKDLAKDSIWNNFKPITKPVETEVKLYKTKALAEAAIEANLKAEEDLTNADEAKLENKVEFKNAQKLKGTISITKKADADDSDEFYFTVEPSKAAKESWMNFDIVEKYFYDEGEKVVEKGGKSVVVVKANETVTSKTIEWNSNQVTPEFTITEVDQYGKAWPKAESKIEKDDSLWHKYKPEHPEASVRGQLIAKTNFTFEYTFKNTEIDRKITLKKVVKNGEFQGPYYFKVTEKDKDVTSDLFAKEVIEKGYVKVSTEDGTVSKNVYGAHEYIITEYGKDGDEYVSYEEYTKTGKAKDFWERYITDIDKNTGKIGVFKLSISNKDKNVTFKVENYDISKHAGIKITKDVPEDYKDLVFKAVYTITKANDKTKLYIRNKDGIFEEVDSYKSEPVEVSKSKPYVNNDFVAWSGEEAPIFTIDEIISDGFELVGYRANEGEEPSVENNAKFLVTGVNTFEMVNTPEGPDETTVSIPIIKTQVSVDGAGVSTKEPQTYFFDIYLNGYVEDTYTIAGKEGKIESAKDKKYAEDYTGYIRVPLTVKAGQTTAKVVVEGLTIKSGTSLKYKVVETDQHGFSYADKAESKEDTIWRKTKPTKVKDPTSSSNKELGTAEGIWKNEISDGKAELVAVEAYNTLRVINIEFEKHVIDDKGERSELEKGESFYFNIEYDGHEDKNQTSYEISLDTNTKYEEQIVLDLDEVLHYTISEVDEKGNTFENRTDDSKVWTEFAPEDGKGIIEGDVKEDVDGDITLVGKNNKNKKVNYGNLVVEKHLSDGNGTVIDNSNPNPDQSFYFIIEQKNEQGKMENVTASMFENKVVKLPKADTIDALELKVGEVESSIIKSWLEGEEAPKYLVKEVDEYGRTKSEHNDLKENKPKDSLWKNYDPQYMKGVERQLGVSYSQEEVKEVVDTVHSERNTDIHKDTYNFKITKYSDGGTIEVGEDFYFQIAKNDIEAVLSASELKEIIPGLTDSDIDSNNSIHFYRTEEEIFDTVTSADVDAEDTYYIIEVDQYGKRVDAKDLAEDSLWHTYSIEGSEDGIFEATEKQDKIDVKNIGEHIAAIYINKTLLEGQSSNKEYTFNVYRDNKKIDTVKVKANTTSEAIIVKWKSNEEAPKIGIKEVGENPVSIHLSNIPDSSYEQVLVDITDDEGNVIDQVPELTLQPEDDHMYTFTFENDAMLSGNFIVSKDIKGADDVTDGPEYHFQYHYIYTDVNGETATSKDYDLYVKANNFVATETISWYKGDEAPYFELWEVGTNPKSVNLANGKVTEVDGIEGITIKDGELIWNKKDKHIYGKINDQSKDTVTVDIENDAWVSGGIHLEKIFQDREKNGDISTLLEEVSEIYGGDYTFDFNVSITAGEGSMFKVNGVSYPNENNTTYTDTISIGIKEFLDAYVTDNDSYIIIDNLKVSWPKGKPAPVYEITEKYDGDFYIEPLGVSGTVSEYQKDNNGKNIVAESNKVTIVNDYLDTRRKVWSLVTEMGGIAWEEAELPNKLLGKDEAEVDIKGVHDGRYNSEYTFENSNEVYKDELLSGIYVRPARVYYKSEGGQLVEHGRMYNGQQTVKLDNVDEPIDYTVPFYFMFDRNTEYDITDSNGNWKIDKISVPALTEIDEQAGITFENGWRIRYDVEFYYDGITYEATDFLVDANGDVNKYMENPNDSKYFNNSFAKEVPEDWAEYSKHYATVSGETPRNADGTSVGKLGEATVNYTGRTIETYEKYVASEYSAYRKDNYEHDENGNIVRYNENYEKADDGIYVKNTTYVSDGIVDLKADSTNYTQTYMKATTAKAGLKYFLSENDNYLNIRLFNDDGYKFYKVINSYTQEEMNDENVQEYIEAIKNSHNEIRIIDHDGITYIEYEEYFMPVEQYALNINLGLVKKSKADVQIAKTIEAATIVINEKAQTYKFINGNAMIDGGDLTENIANKLSGYISDNKIEDIQDIDPRLNIYTSDYVYRVNEYGKETDLYNAYDRFYRALYGYGPNDNTVNDLVKSKELQIYLTYRIKLTNNSGKYDVVVNTIDDYSESTLEYVDVISGYIADKNGKQATDLGAGLWAYVTEDDGDSTKLALNKDGTPKLTDLFEKYSDWKVNSFKSGEYGTPKYAGNITTNNVNHAYNKTTITIPHFDTEILSDDGKIEKISDNGIRLTADKNGKTYNFYTTYRVSDYEKVKDGEFVLGDKRNIAEISSFTAYYTKDKLVPAAVIDKDAAPGNYNLTQDTYMQREDDTNYGEVKIGTKENADRTISGIAWLDREDINSKNVNGQKTGDGLFDDDDYRLENITTKLVEVVDLPDVNDQGEFELIKYKDESGNYVNKQKYTEYEFYWDNDSVTTAPDGTYLINSTTIDGAKTNGIVAGNYEVRFFYGDKADVKINDKDGNPIDVSEQSRINGIDYKTTTYEAANKPYNEYVDNEWLELNSVDGDNEARDRDNEARDNEARRLVLIDKTQILNNKNTAIFDVANYDDAKAYADAKNKRLKYEELNAEAPNFVSDYNKYMNQLYSGFSYENGTTAYNGIIRADNYTMFADSAKINLKLEYHNNQTKITDIGDGKEEVSGGDSASSNNIRNVNFGLEERSKTNIILDKQIKEITFTKPETPDDPIFHIEYDIYYGTTSDIEVKDRGTLKDIGNGLYVAVVPKEESIKGDNILQSVNQRIDGNNIVNGYRYINVDSGILQGLKVTIKYQFTAINLSETETYGEDFDKIMNIEYKEVRNDSGSFDRAIDKLSSPNYVLGEATKTEGQLLHILSEDITDENSNIKFVHKPYGRYLGHTYYQGINDEYLEKGDHIVYTTVRKVIDYVDNDIAISNNSDATENQAKWSIIKSNDESLMSDIDENVFVNGQILNEIEQPYADNHIAITNSADKDFVKGLEPLDYVLAVKNHDSNEALPEETQAITYITLEDTKSATDIGDYGVDNYAEILEVESPVGSGVKKTPSGKTVVYGNFDPRGGATSVIESDESSTEIITLSPPTGNIENERAMWTAIGIITVVALLAGAGTGVGLKLSSKKGKKDTK